MNVFETFAPCQSPGSIYRITRLARDPTKQEGERNCIKKVGVCTNAYHLEQRHMHARMFFNTYRGMRPCVLYTLCGVRRAVCLCAVCVLWFPQWPSERRSVYVAAASGRDKSWCFRLHDTWIGKHRDAFAGRPAAVARKLAHKTHCEWANIARRRRTTLLDVWPALLWLFTHWFFSCAERDSADNGATGAQLSAVYVAILLSSA